MSKSLGEAKVVCMTAVPGLLEYIQHHPAALHVKEADTVHEDFKLHLRGTNEIWTNTGAPQCCVLSPGLFTLHKLDCHCGAKGLQQVKFSDDTPLSGMIIKEENTYRTAIQKLVEWCDDNVMLLNISKTKELVTDFWRNASLPVPLQIKRQQVNIVHQCKYLGTILNNKLDWTENLIMLLKKGNQHLYFLKKLKSFHVNPHLLKAFYQIAYASSTASSTKKVHQVVKTASRLIGSEVIDGDTHYEQKVLRLSWLMKLIL